MSGQQRDHLTASRSTQRAAALDTTCPFTPTFSRAVQSFHINPAGRDHGHILVMRRRRHGLTVAPLGGQKSNVGQ